MNLLKNQTSEHTLTVHLVVRDVEKAGQFYQAAFGAVERDRLPLPGGKVMYIELHFGDTRLMIADEFPEYGILSPLSIGGTASVFHLVTDDAHALWQQAMEAGAKEYQPLREQFWGDLNGQLLDPSGHRWGVTQHIRQVSREELEREAATVFGGGGEPA